jgi:hypothetical protein
MGIRQHEGNPPFDLQGDVISVSSSLCCAPLLLLNCFQLSPLSAVGNVLPFPPRLLVSGYVDSVDRVADSFTVITFQWIEGSTLHDELTIVSRFKPTKRWPIPNSHMPNAKGLVFFSGIVQHMQNTSVSLIVSTINFLNKKAHLTTKSLARHSKLEPMPPHRRPSCAVLRTTKRSALDASWEAFFKKEKEYFSAD